MTSADRIFHAGMLLLFFLIGIGVSPTAAQSLRLGRFDVDVTPPVGSPVAYAPTRKIDDPLSARGVVLLGAGEPIVLCAVDFIGIGNEGYRDWLEALAQAASTQTNRVAVHTLHQHDGPRWDSSVERMVARHGLGGRWFDSIYHRGVLERLAAAVMKAVDDAEPVTHVEYGKARVERVASNRRILGPEGKVELIRWSKTVDPRAIAAPEGLIDPELRLISFWNKDQSLAVMTYYATHPQSYYGQGDVTCEFVGIARNRRQEELAGLLHVHFNGASGNVTAGKYNDGSPENRPVLAERMRTGMQKAWEGRQRIPVSSDQVTWQTVDVQLPAAEYLNQETLQTVLEDPQADATQRLSAAEDLVWLARCTAGDVVTLSCLKLGPVRLVHLPGEAFIEYQLYAQSLAPNTFTAVAAYGDYGSGYIATEEAYPQGGYEVRPGISRVSPKVEQVLRDALRQVLK